MNINKKMLLSLLIIFFISLSSIASAEESTNYSLEYAHDMISRFVLNNYEISTNHNNLKLCNSETIIGPNGNPSWKFSIQKNEDESYYVYFDCISGYISGVSRYADEIDTAITSPNNIKETLRDFIQYNYDIQVNIDNIQLTTNYPVTRSNELVWEFTCTLSDNDSITIYIDCETGNICGFKLGENTKWFETSLEDAHYIASDLLYSCNRKPEPCQLYPIKDKEGNFVWKFSQTIDTENYYVYIDTLDYTNHKIEAISSNKTYKVDYSSIEHESLLFDKNYAKNLAMSYGKHLGLQENSITLNLESDELELPWFNDVLPYEDSCWVYSISDNVNSYKLFISGYTGEVCEIDNLQEKEDNNPTIDYTEAKSIAENFLKKANPDKFQRYIFTGNRSIYADGWTVFRYNRYEDGILYANNVLTVYLNIDGSIHSFYQTCEPFESTLPYK